LTRSLILEAGKQLALMGSLPPSIAPARASAKPWMGERQQVFLPVRAEGAMQLCSFNAEAGYCILVVPQASEWGGADRPPEVLLAYAAADGLHVSRCLETGREEVGRQGGELDISAPLLCVLELRPTLLRLALGTGELRLDYRLPEEVESEVFVWLWNSRKGEADFFDCAFMDLTPPLAGTSFDRTEAAMASAASDGAAARSDSGSSDSAEAPSQQHPPAAAEGAGYCQSQ